ncbi:MAG: hypothetical protein AAB933_01370 [Patescibacteria group bacterium]
MKNNKKGFIVPLLLGIIALLVIGGGIYIYNNKKVETSISLLKLCPSEKISNQMPVPGGTRHTTYFILNGQRRELSEFDLSWVEKNCTVKEHVVF